MTELIKQAKEGQPKAVLALWQLNQKSVKALKGWYRVDKLHDEDDVESLCRFGFWNAIVKFDPNKKHSKDSSHTAFESYVFRCMKCALDNNITKRNRATKRICYEESIYTDNVNGQSILDTLGHDSHIEDTITRDELSNQFWSSLTEKERQIVVWKVDHQTSMQKISGYLKISEATITKMWKEIREKFQKVIDNQTSLV